MSRSIYDYGVRSHEQAGELREDIFGLMENNGTLEDVEDYLLSEGVDLDALEFLF